MKNFTIRLGGPAGWGIASGIDILSKILLNRGYYLFSTKDYSSQIRGGHDFHTLIVSNRDISSEIGPIDLLIAPDQLTYDRHSFKVKKEGLILGINQIQLNPKISTKTITINVSNKNSSPLAILIGATTCILGINFEETEGIIKEHFVHNLGLCDVYLMEAKEGFASSNLEVKLPVLNSKVKSENLKIVSGNDAITFGALKAGLTFHAQYPMTPVSGILHNLAKEATKGKIKVIMPEDEISAINLALGASFAGSRAMTATSGGGFSLMVESFGLAGMAEIPLVIIEGQRPGPATGLPTKTEQGDLKFVLSAAPGDFPRVVIAPTTIESCYTETKRAFYLAEKYQLPVMVLIDKHLAESNKTMDLVREESVFQFDYNKRINILDKVKTVNLNQDGLFKRYAINNFNRTLPGTANGIFTCAGDEHDEVGEITDNPIIRKEMMHRRMEKLDKIKSELPVPKLFGSKEADYTIVTWSSNYETILEAISEINDCKINILPITYMCPFHTEVIKKILSSSKNIILIENNYSGQLGDLIAEKTGIIIPKKILKYDGVAFTVEEIKTKLNKIIK